MEGDAPTACRASASIARTGAPPRGLLVLALVAAVPARSAPPAREAWRTLQAGRVTVVGTASDVRLVDTAVTLRALAALLPTLVPGTFEAPAPLVAAVVSDPAHLLAVGYPPAAAPGSRVVIAATSDEEARPELLRAAVSGLVARAGTPLPAWLATGLGEYLSTFSATESKATVGRLVPEHVARLRDARARSWGAALFTPGTPAAEGSAEALRRAEAWAVVHVLLQGTPDGEERVGRYVALVAGGRDLDTALREAFGQDGRALLARARAHVVDSRPLARVLAVSGAPPVGRLLPLTRAGAAGLLGGVASGRRAPDGERAGSPGGTSLPGTPAPGFPSLAGRTPAPVSRDVPAEVDLVNRLVDEGREEEALARLEALHASLGRDPEMQRALGWDVQEVRRVVVHNRLVRRYNEAIGLLNADRYDLALPIFREVAAAAEDPGLRRLAWERATAPNGGRR